MNNHQCDDIIEMEHLDDMMKEEKPLTQEYYKLRWGSVSIIMCPLSRSLTPHDRRSIFVR